MSDIVRIDVGKFCFTSAPFTHHSIYPDQIPREEVQANRHEPNAVNESQLSLNLLCLIFVSRDADVEADVLFLVFSNDTDRSKIELLPQISDEQMHIVTTQVVKNNGDVVGNCIPKVALLMSGTSVFPSVGAMISNYCVIFMKFFKADVALPCPTELSPLFWH